MKKALKRIGAITAALALLGVGFWQGMATEAAKFSRFVDASVAVYALVKDTPQGAELKAAYNELWIAGKIRGLKPVAVPMPSTGPSLPVAAKAETAPVNGGAGPVGIDTLWNMIEDQKGVK